MVKCSDRQRLVSQPVFKEFLESHAPKLYKIILDSILSERHGEKKGQPAGENGNSSYMATTMYV